MAEAIEEVGGIISLDVESFLKDRRARFSLRYSIVLIVESLADIAVAILEKDFNEIVESHRDAIMKLRDKGLLGRRVAESIARLVSLRNLIVHRYRVVDDLKIYESAKNSGVESIERFIEEVSRYVEVKDY
ncbi:MAG: DUF86 domain-containing protein [Thaumarchaeota archaeon]|nr:DUF86 domain-containing protein [Candidatus Geocrenenecus arthurdayi]